MKIGILTFQNAVNYGAVLQAYALQNSIEKLGAEVRLIDYQCNKVNSLYDPFPKTTNLKKFVSNLLWYQRKKKKKMAFERFEKKYLKLTDKKYYTKQELKKSQTFLTFNLFFPSTVRVTKRAQELSPTTFKSVAGASITVATMVRIGKAATG